MYIYTYMCGIYIDKCTYYQHQQLRVNKQLQNMLRTVKAGGRNVRSLGWARRACHRLPEAQTPAQSMKIYTIHTVQYSAVQRYNFTPNTKLTLVCAMRLYSFYSNFLYMCRRHRRQRKLHHNQLRLMNERQTKSKPITCYH